MEEATPRAIIRGLLTSSSNQKSAKSARQSKITREANQRNLSVIPPSEKDVAYHLLTRTTRSSKKRRAASVSTPSDSTTPRTLITGFLQTAVTKNTLKSKRRKVQDTDSESIIKEDPNNRRVEDDTPRTIIQNYLREATRELPEEVVVSGSSSKNEETAIVKKDHMSVDQGHISTTRNTSFSNTSTLDFGSNEKEVVGGEPWLVSQALQTEPVSRSVGQAQSHWRDLVTPQLPLDMLSTVGEKPGANEDLDQSSIVERTLPSKKPPTGEPSSRNVGPRMPVALVKSIFQHFSKAKLTKGAVEAIQNSSDLFFKQVSSDLMAFSRHAHRSTIELADVELLMRRRIKDSQLTASINQKLVESGERERLKELLRTKLIECGWRDELRTHCKEVIKQKGLENITVDDLVAEITPKGRALVPDEVKKDLLLRIRTFLAANS